ncbi:DUF4294 domain-containing protein [Myroides ceti]|uniref:DUF4294 domain-containing protein n=1 Tax=Paenimyroides ceti TaxID=395087 RepID=A0ABT8CWT9_9FLAO|nr:DUF4294 domain-containing protein [Paenimyroides ceti]MDN3707499.1 DUF4294 domain-containing protein [Paenimyroides ceti]
MKKILIFIVGIFFSNCLQAQVVNDWEKYADTISSTLLDNGDIEQEFLLPEMMINFSKEEMERVKTMNVLKRRILRVYPYVVATSDNLLILNENLAKMDTKKRRNAYIKRSEDYLEKQFKDRLKKLSRKDGQILVKLINRQTGQTTFDLVKEFKSGWTAFWSNQTAKLFDINLKTKYNPKETLEDFYIELLLLELTAERKIDYRNPAKNINLSQLRTDWKIKLGDSGYYPEE